MLTFRNSRWALGAAALLAALLWLVAAVPPWWLAGPLLIHGALVAYGSSQISSNFFLKTRCAAQTSRREIALTFDDGPVETTPLLLEILRRHEVQATFFCIGRQVSRFPHLLRQIAAEGHTVGNHSYSHHALIDLYSTRRLVAEIKATDQVIAAVIGKTPRLFRPPYGVTTPNFARALAATGHACIGWNVRSMDTVIRPEARLLRRLLAALRPGAVFLLHDTSRTTVQALDAFLQQAKARGFSIVSLPHLLEVQPYE